MRRREFIRLFTSTIVAWPAVAHAQQPAMPVVGVLGSAAPAVYVERLTAIRQGLAENGFTESLGALIVYPSVDRLIEALEDKIVRPAEAKFHEFLDVDHHRVRQVRFPELPQR